MRGTAQTWQFLARTRVRLSARMFSTPAQDSGVLFINLSHGGVGTPGRIA